MNSVLNYCDYNKALNESYRVLRKNGLIIGTVNNRLIYSSASALLNAKDPELFSKGYRSGDIVQPFQMHNFTVLELETELSKAGFEIRDLLGPSNLLRKWEYEDIVTPENEEKLLHIQVEFSRKKEYLNNSSDFMFIAKKL